jgi:hypothetical protein
MHTHTPVKNIEQRLLFELCEVARLQALRYVLVAGRQVELRLRCCRVE